MHIHIVQKGDSIWSIAQRYGVSVQRILTDNDLTDPRSLVVGQALIILISETVYTVRSGDTLSSIARRFGMTEMELLQNNPDLISNPILQPGQLLALRFAGGKLRTVSLNGYAYPNIRPEILRRALPYLTYLTIFSYGFTAQGDLIPINDQPLINMAYRYKAAPVMMISSITEDGTFSGERAAVLFESPTLQDRAIEQIIANMKEKGYLGLDIDFEYIRPEDAEAYLRFLEKVTSRVRAEGFFTVVDVAPKVSATQAGLLYEAHNYPAFGQLADAVFLMTYEWGYTFGPPMAVAPIDQVRRVVRYAASEIPAEKLVMGIPNYGYDWALPFVRGTSRATTVGNSAAVNLAARYGAELQYDETAQSPYFNYWARGGVKHVVWFEDVRSIQAKFELLDEFDLRGAGYWNLMRPFAQNWALVSWRYRVQKVVV